MYKTYVICYFDMNGNTVWESIYGSDATDERVYNLAMELNCDPLDILVFDYDTELSMNFRNAKKYTH